MDKYYLYSVQAYISVGDDFFLKLYVYIPQYGKVYIPSSFLHFTVSSTLKYLWNSNFYSSSHNVSRISIKVLVSYRSVVRTDLERTKEIGSHVVAC